MPGNTSAKRSHLNKDLMDKQGAKETGEGRAGGRDGKHLCKRKQWACVEA